MITIITGSNNLRSYTLVETAMAKCEWVPTRILSPGTSSIAKLGERWAIEHQVPLEVMPANLGFYGNRERFYRNGEMAKRAQALVAIWNGKSSTTQNMIRTAMSVGLRVFVMEAGLTAKKKSDRIY